MDRTKVKGTKRKNIPNFKDVTLPINPIINGRMAPPAIPVHNMPDMEPWCLATELSPNDTIMDHITEMVNPSAGNAITAILAEPVNAKNKQIKVAIVANIKTRRLSMNFRRIRPRTQPKVNMAQKYETVSAPVL